MSRIIGSDTSCPHAPRTQSTLKQGDAHACAMCAACVRAQVSSQCRRVRGAARRVRGAVRRAPSSLAGRGTPCRTRSCTCCRATTRGASPWRAAPRGGHHPPRACGRAAAAARPAR
eukprot:983969-Prymnesium_polylepis.1